MLVNYGDGFCKNEDREPRECTLCGYSKALDTKPIRRFALMLRKKDPQRTIYAARNGILNIQGLPALTFWRQFRFEKADFGVSVRALEAPDIVPRVRASLVLQPCV